MITSVNIELDHNNHERGILKQLNILARKANFDEHVTTDRNYKPHLQFTLKNRNVLTTSLHSSRLA